MRISDWSSDVCSSDLRTAGAEAATIGQVDVLVERGGEDRGAFLDLKATATGAQRHNKTHPILSIYRCLIAQDGFIRTAMGRVQYSETAAIRSEEHTSELQSLMRNSYAVFCLQNKN